MKREEGKEKSEKKWYFLTKMIHIKSRRDTIHFSLFSVERCNQFAALLYYYRSSDTLSSMARKMAMSHPKSWRISMATPSSVCSAEKNW